MCSKSQLKRNIRLQKNEKHKVFKRYSQFIVKKSKDHEFLVQEHKFLMFVINGKSIVNFLDRHFNNDNLKMFSTPKID